jgi:hypothetical protein
LGFVAFVGLGLVHVHFGFNASPPRCPPNRVNPMDDSANSIGQALGGALAGDWNQIEDAYDSGIFGQTQDAGPVPYYGTRAAVGVATVCATAAAAVGTYEFVALGNQSIMVEGVLGGGRMGSGGLFQLRVPGQPPIIRFDFHPFPGSGGRPLPHVDSPPLGWHHWPWQ